MPWVAGRGENVAAGRRLSRGPLWGQGGRARPDRLAVLPSTPSSGASRGPAPGVSASTSSTRVISRPRSESDRQTRSDRVQPWSAVASVHRHFQGGGGAGCVSRPVVSSVVRPLCHFSRYGLARRPRARVGRGRSFAHRRQLHALLCVHCAEGLNCRLGVTLHADLESPRCRPSGSTPRVGCTQTSERTHRASSSIVISNPMKGRSTSRSEIVVLREKCARKAASAAYLPSGRYVALKYLADGWWKTRAETEASGSIMWPSVSWMPTSSGRSTRHSVSWSARFGHAG